MGHCHICAAQRGQMVSLSALETNFMGRVMCPTSDREKIEIVYPQALSSSNLRYCLSLPSTL